MEAEPSVTMDHAYYARTIPHSLGNLERDDHTAPTPPNLASILLTASGG